MEGLFLAFYFLALYGGLLLPVPCPILAWREWIKIEAAFPTNKTWRRIMSRIGLLLGSLATAMAVYTAIAEARGALSQQLYYGSRTMSFGLGGSLAVIVVSAFAEGRLRRYLLLGAVGLLCFFSFGVGEAI
jgi:uncharacterized membrane protein